MRYLPLKYLVLCSVFVLTACNLGGMHDVKVRAPVVSVAALKTNSSLSIVIQGVEKFDRIVKPSYGACDRQSYRLGFAKDAERSIESAFLARFPGAKKVDPDTNIRDGIVVRIESYYATFSCRVDFSPVKAILIGITDTSCSSRARIEIVTSTIRGGVERSQTTEKTADGASKSSPLCSEGAKALSAATSNAFEGALQKAVAQVR